MKKLIRKLLTIDALWWPIVLSLGTVSTVYEKLKNAREWELTTNERMTAAAECMAADTDRIERLTRIESALESSSGWVVRNGPFKGMRYPEKIAFGSAFYPKILGSYEREISEAITYVISHSYSSIVDIGCAEGYYAVGLGMKSNSKVFAFDTNADALEVCREMGRINGVDVNIGGFCDKNTLLSMELGSHALIFCDCEGYEIELIDQKLAENLRQHDFLVETHDFVQIEITSSIIDALSRTHACQVFESIDDIVKAYKYDFPELVSFNLAERKNILEEGRPKIMRWVFAKSKDVIVAKTL
jgi:precorrin-6B methylase 2